MLGGSAGGSSSVPPSMERPPCSLKCCPDQCSVNTGGRARLDWLCAWHGADSAAGDGVRIARRRRKRLPRAWQRLHICHKRARHAFMLARGHLPLCQVAHWHFATGPAQFRPPSCMVHVGYGDVLKVHYMVRARRASPVRVRRFNFQPGACKQRACATGAAGEQRPHIRLVAEPQPADRVHAGRRARHQGARAPRRRPLRGASCRTRPDSRTCCRRDGTWA